MKKVLFDIETDGLIEAVTTVWCLVVKDLETGEVRRFGPHLEDDGISGQPGIITGVRLLDNAELLAGHNIVSYDIPVLRKLFPWAKLMPPVIRDTLIIAKLVWPDIRALDFGCYERWNMPRQMIGRQGLKAWGYRLGLHKIDYTDWCAERGLDPWACWRQEMEDYCVGDVELNHRLFLALAKKKPPKRAMDLEMAYAEIAYEMELNGFPVNTGKLVALYADLCARREELTSKVAELFQPWWASLGEVTVKTSRNVRVPGEGHWIIREKGKTKKADLEAITGPMPPGWNAEEAATWHHQGLPVEFVPVLCEYAAGAVYTEIEWRTLNPSSRDHIADRLMKLYGWKPVEFGKNGKPTLDDEIMAELPFPPCKLLSEYFMILKRLGQVGEGRMAWLKLARDTEVAGRKRSRLHGRMDTIGTVTFRCSHSNPNMAQVPSVHNAEGKVPYGFECRDAFEPEEGFVLLGCDAAGLQLRGLAHNMAPYDGGRYIELASAGDVHTANKEAAGLDTRDRAKRFIYTYLFGGGGWKIGTVIGGCEPSEVLAALPGVTGYGAAVRHLGYVGLPPTQENIAVTLKGMSMKARFTKRTVGLTDLIESVQHEARCNKHLIGLDGRIVPVRSPHAALNTKLMSDEAVICKEWKVLSHRELRAMGLRNGRDFMQHADVHDELQMGVRKEIAQDVAPVVAAMVAKAGENLGYRCPLAGEFKLGSSWAHTH